jgi:glycosyltransferase involved in cell wall biosynthesis
MPDVSVNIITCNRPAYLERAIKSVLSQEGCDFELVIIDTGHGINRKLVEKFNDSRIRYSVFTTQHLADARNFALKESKGDYIAILDDDDEWVDKHKLSLQLELFKNDKKLILCGTQINRIYPDGSVEINKIYPIGDPDIRDTMLLENPFCHSSTMYNRGVALSVGGYKPVKGLWNINEYELWLNLGLYGYMYNMREQTTNYTVWTNSMTLRHRIKLYLKDFKMAWDYRKYYPNFGRALCRYFITYPLKKILNAIGLG